MLGIGDSLDTEELKNIASGPYNIFTVDTYTELGNRADSIKRSICIFGNIFRAFFDQRVTSIYWVTAKSLNLTELCLDSHSGFSFV